jgi:murein L,D-transpeptidase YcbB/YkuD
MSIAVGTRSFKSPRGEFAITSVEWNPWWIPPASAWAVKEKATPPGPGNPMGNVKMNFRPLYFLHGTPLDASIGSAASHGCIRLHNDDAIALARLVHRFGSPSLATTDVDRLVADTATKRIELETPIPIALRYERVEVRADTAFVYRDVYGIATHSLASEIARVLAIRGLDTTRLDAARIRRLTSRVPARGRGMPLRDLFDGSLPPSSR